MAEQTFKIEGEFIHLIQLLKALNWVQTGGHAQLVVMEGEVRYNGQVDYRKRLKVLVIPYFSINT